MDTIVNVHEAVRQLSAEARQLRDSLLGDHVDTPETSVRVGSGERHVGVCQCVG